LKTATAKHWALHDRPNGSTVYVRYAGHIKDCARFARETSSTVALEGEPEACRR